MLPRERLCDTQYRMRTRSLALLFGNAPAALGIPRPDLWSMVVKGGGGCRAPLPKDFCAPTNACCTANPSTHTPIRTAAFRCAQPSVIYTYRPTAAPQLHASNAAAERAPVPKHSKIADTISECARMQSCQCRNYRKRAVIVAVVSWLARRMRGNWVGNVDVEDNELAMPAAAQTYC